MPTAIPDPPPLDAAACYRALRARDARFDGRFYTGVRTTGVFCRPVCPARTPRPERCLFFPSAAAALAAGFRPCLRCRPELAPGVAGWRGTANTVARAVALVAEGAWSEETSVEALAERVGVGGRHLRRLFERHVGASPVAVAQAQRVLLAKRLLAETALSMADVALASGFGSVRRFNHVVRRTFGRAPRELRRSPSPHPPPHASRGEGEFVRPPHPPLGASRGGGEFVRPPHPPPGASRGEGLRLRLGFTRPYHWPAMLAFLGARAIPGVEAVVDGAYRRAIAIDGARGTLAVRLAPDGAHLLADLELSRLAALPAAVGRVRRLLDLDADAEEIDAHLCRDPVLAPRVAARPGLRVPGTWDPFELAVRAVLGQQISVAAARTLAGRIAARWGERAGDDPACARVFPDAARLAGARLDDVGLTRARAAALGALARACADDPALLAPAGELEAALERLCALPGVGRWTAQVIAMRALREPDAFPASDLGLLRALERRGERPTPAALLRRAERWRPWRAYAAVHLWTGEAGSSRAAPGGGKERKR